MAVQCGTMQGSMGKPTQQWHIITTDDELLNNVGLGVFTTGQLYEFCRLNHRDPRFCTDIPQNVADTYSNSDPDKLFVQMMGGVGYSSIWNEGLKKYEEIPVGGSSPNAHANLGSRQFGDQVTAAYGSAQPSMVDSQVPGVAGGTAAYRVALNLIAMNHNYVEGNISKLPSPLKYLNLVKASQEGYCWYKPVDKFFFNTHNVNGVGCWTPINPTFKLYLFDKNYYNDNSRTLVQRGSPSYVALPETPHGLEYSMTRTEEGGNKPGYFLRPEGGGDNNPRNVVAGDLDTYYEANTGKFEAGTRQILARMLTALEAVIIPPLPVDEIDQLSQDDVFLIDGDFYMGTHNVGIAMPVSVQHGNPHHFGPIWTDPECTVGQKETITVINRSTDSFYAGDLVLCTRISGEWVVQEFGRSAALVKFGIKNWGGFTNLISDNDSYFKDGRYYEAGVRSFTMTPPIGGIPGVPLPYTNPYGATISSEAYEEVFKDHFWYAFPGWANTAIRAINDVDKIRLANLSLPPTATAVPAPDFVGARRGYWQMTSFDLLSSIIGGKHSHSVIGRTNMSHQQDGVTMADKPNARAFYPFWGATFENGYFPEKLTKLRNDPAIGLIPMGGNSGGSAHQFLSPYAGGVAPMSLDLSIGHTATIFGSDLDRQEYGGIFSTIERQEYWVPEVGTPPSEPVFDANGHCASNCNREFPNATPPSPPRSTPASSDWVGGHTGHFHVRFTTAYDTAEKVALQLPADVALNASPSGRHGGPIEDVSQIIAYANAGATVGSLPASLGEFMKKQVGASVGYAGGDAAQSRFVWLEARAPGLAVSYTAAVPAVPADPYTGDPGSPEIPAVYPVGSTTAALAQGSLGFNENEKDLSLFDLEPINKAQITFLPLTAELVASRDNITSTTSVPLVAVAWGGEKDHYARGRSSINLFGNDQPTSFPAKEGAGDHPIPDSWFSRNQGLSPNFNVGMGFDVGAGSPQTQGCLIGNDPVDASNIGVLQSQGPSCTLPMVSTEAGCVACGGTWGQYPPGYGVGAGSSMTGAGELKIATDYTYLVPDWGPLGMGGQSFSPQQRGASINGIPYNWHVMHKFSYRNGPANMWGTDPKSGGDVVGITTAKAKITAAGTSVKFETDNLFGMPPLSKATNGDDWEIISVGGIAGGAVGSVGGGSVTTSTQPQWGNGSDNIEDMGTTALWAKLYAEWPNDQTIFDPRYFAVFHFNPGAIGSLGGAKLAYVGIDAFHPGYPMTGSGVWDIWTPGEAIPTIWERMQATPTESVDFRIPTQWENAGGRIDVAAVPYGAIIDGSWVNGNYDPATGGISPLGTAPGNVFMAPVSDWKVNPIRRGMLLPFIYYMRTIGLNPAPAAFDIIEGGIDFVIGDFVTFVGGGGQGAKAKVKQIGGGGSITELEFVKEGGIEQLGFGYTAQDFPDPNVPGTVVQHIVVMVKLTGAGQGATIGATQGIVYELPLKDEGPKQQGGSVRLTPNSNSGRGSTDYNASDNAMKGYVTAGMIAELPIDDPSPDDKYDLFLHFHSDISHTFSQSSPFNPAHQQFVRLTISAQ